jgi:phosphoenolpyruvate-protein phosphotransferase (PTS system enzyme I)
VHRLTGIGVSPGVAIGRAVLLMQNPLVLRFPIAEAQVGDEVARLREARERSRRQLQEIKVRIARRAGAELGYLFEAQLLMLEDPMLLDRALSLVREERVNAEWAVQRAFEDLSGIFDGIDDAYLRERKGDVADVVGRLRMNLNRTRGRGPDLFRDVEAPSVLVADELTPSMAAQVDWRKILGFASDIGSRTHHTAILARSLQVPAVVGLGQASTRVAPGATVIIDGDRGEIVVDPDPGILDEARHRPPVPSLAAVRLQRRRPAPVRTSDAVRIALQANIELFEDLAVARAQGAEGIGLYRSEFLLATRSAETLTEEVQFRAYRALAEGMAPGTVTVRTFDVDEEQLAPWPRNGNTAASPGNGASRGALGLRAIRLSLERREMFKTQLRALLRAARHGKLRIIFPFVSGVEELREAKAVLREAASELEAKGQLPKTLPPIGVMIEVPSAAITADLLAREAEFFSIGTNDLIQYSLAVDRTDARISRLYEPVHPALLRTIRGIVRAAERRGIPVSLCGEMASDPILLPVLVGLGLRDFSMSPGAIPVARRVILRLSSIDARRLAARIMRLSTVSEIEQCLARTMGTAERDARGSE